MEDDLQSLFTLFDLPVTAYGLCMALAAGAGLLAFALISAKRKIPENAVLAFSLLCLPLGLLGARLFYCLARIDLYLAMGLESVLRFTEGGYALWGAIGGVALAAVLAARIGHAPLAVLLDQAAAPGMLALALGRFAEYFSGEGYGLYVQNESFMFFPLAVSKFGDWRWAIFMLEGGAALVIFVLTLLHRQKRPGDRARLALILFCASQIFFESLRQDSFLRWEVRFIRISELPAVALLAVLMGCALIRGKKAGRVGIGSILLHIVFFLAAVGIFIWMEFAVQKSAALPVWLCYTTEAVCCTVLGAATCHAALSTK